MTNVEVSGLANTVSVSGEGNEITITRVGAAFTSLDGPVLFTARNNSGGSLAKGELVYISGHTGDKPDVGRALASNASMMPAVGYTYESAAQGADLQIVTMGDLVGVNTSIRSEGDILYVDGFAAGSSTATPPAGESNVIQNVGIVLRSDETAGRIMVTGPGRANATPNLNTDKIFLGNGSNQAAETALSSVGLTKFNNDLTSAYTGQIETVANKTYTIDPGAATARTITGFYIKSDSGTCTAALKVGTNTVKGSVSVSTSSGDQTGLANTSVSVNDVITLVLSANSSATDVIFSVEYTG